MTSQQSSSISSLDASGSWLTVLARRYGVATEYAAADGRIVVVPDETLISILAALGIPAATDAERAEAFNAYDRDRWSRALPPVIVARQGAAKSFWVHVPHGSPARLWIRLEDGSVRAGLRQLDNFTSPFDLDGRLIGEASFELPADLPLGYHRLHLDSPNDEPGGDRGAALIVTPNQLTVPEHLGSRRTWGLAVQLYSVRSEHSWGIGDLTDLADLAVWAGTQHGAGFVLVNPLHAAAPTAPMEPSPYLPTSRRFVNPIYLRPEAIAEYAYVQPRRAIRKARNNIQTAADRTDGIDRDGIWAAKRTALEQVYRVPRSVGRELDYQAFRYREGRALDDFATWSALAESYGADWREWPEELQHPDTEEVGDFAAEHADTVDFHRWLQWQLDDQLAATALRTGQIEMALGVMHDLAVGVHPAGADAWSLQHVLTPDVTVGAPPDAFNQQGQDWSQPPWRPDQLVEHEYEPFRALVRTVLRHAGGLRIDHIMGLFRLWWIPEGAPPTEGTYVHYDHEAMVGILVLEAQRAGALIVGEDLGVVEPWVRDYLRERGVFGTSILWFERNGAPLRAERWREYCLASVTTHDLPPTAGYLAAEHVTLRNDLGVLTRPFDEELADDRAELDSWLEELRRVGLLDDEVTADDLVSSAEYVDDIVLALHRYLGRTPSKLLALSLADAVGDRRTQNQPGTTDEYPNWRVPLCGPDGRKLLLENIFRDGRAATLAAAMHAEVKPAAHS